MKNSTVEMLERLGIVVLFGIAFAYIESAVVVYLRVILGGRHATEPDYAKYFSPGLFAAGFALGGAVCLRALLRAQTNTA